MKLESIREVNKSGKEKKILELEEKNITSFISKIKEKYPSFEKVVKTPMAIARLLAVFATLQGGQIFAQDVLNKNEEAKDPFTLENIHELNTMTLPEIESLLDSSKLPPPQDQIKFSYTFYGNENGSSEETHHYEHSYEGTAPIDTGMVGDVEVYHSLRSVNRDDQVISSNKEGNAFFKGRALSTETKVFDVANKKIEKSTDDKIRTVFGFGNTKQDAIQNAIGSLINSTGVLARSGITSSNEGQQSNGVGTIHRRMTTYITAEGINVFKNLHIDKIEKEGGGYRAYVSAQKGQIQTNS